MIRKGNASRISRREHSDPTRVPSASLILSHRSLPSPIPMSAFASTVRPITEVAHDLGLSADHLEPYGRDKGQGFGSQLWRIGEASGGKLILVSAITPTPAGEGKTTTSIGLAQGLRKIGKNAVLALRQPSMGPVFGRKGGATGGGACRLTPSGPDQPPVHRRLPRDHRRA